MIEKIRLQLPSSSEESLLTISSLVGRNSTFIKLQRGRDEIDISSWLPGIYVFSIFEEGVLLQTEKVVVVK